MTSEDPEPEIDEAPEPVETLPTPEEADVEPPPPVDETAFAEGYDDLVEPEEVEKKPRKKRRYGWIIVLSAVLVFLLLWTAFTPENMAVVGTVYLNDQDYANLANFSGEVSTWAADTTFGISVSGPSSAAANTTVEIEVLITKVSEDLKNSFFQGTSISLENVSIYVDEGNGNGLRLASMTEKQNVDYGVVATVPISFSAPGEYNLFVRLSFMMYGDMMIGFLPLKSVNVDELYFDADFVVS